MKIIFTISSTGHGNGGHFYDLKAIANKISINHSIMVINIGKKMSKVLIDQNFKLHFLYYNGVNIFKVYYKLFKIINDYKPDIIHSFDVYSFNFSRLLSWKLNQQTYLTKCGGPNPKSYYPKADNLFIVSDENKLFFSNDKGYASSNIYFVPQRVSAVNLDDNRAKSFLKKHQINGEIILRINRISNHYFSTMIQSVNLLKYLLKLNKNVKLVIIGSIQDKAVLRKIQDYIIKHKLAENVIIDNSSEFSKNASELLGLGDYVIGTGRNFMEAASLNKLLLVPYSTGNFPLMVTEHNFNRVKHSNFSPRTKIDNFNLNDNLDNIISLNPYPNSKEWFDKYFCVNKGSKKYIEIYKHTKFMGSKIRLFDFVLNTIYSIIKFIK